MRELKLGLKDTEILHVVPVPFTDKASGKSITLYQVTLVIESLSQNAVTAFMSDEPKRGRQKLEVSITGKGKDELKFKLRLPAANPGGKAA